MSADNLLIVADSVHNANMLYATGVFVPDPFIYLRIKDRDILITSDHEVDRVRQEAPHCRVISLSTCLRNLKRDGLSNPTFANVIQRILLQRGEKRVHVPNDFPLTVERQLEKLKVKVKLRQGQFFPGRELKNGVELRKINAALIMAEVGMSEAIHTLRNAKVGKGKALVHHGAPLTAEKLRSIIEVAVLQAGGAATGTIVSCGRQSCDPHQRGHGTLKAGQPIVIDIYPRSQKTGYHGDITRTVVKGRASDAVRKLYHAVARAQEIAFSMLVHKAPARDPHRAIQEFFLSQGFRTGRFNGRLEGFFHGLGHGVGLDIHEPPRLNALSRDLLWDGQVVTNEPGLYYPSIGGVRIEDMVHIMKGGPKNLTKFEKVLEV